MIYTSYFANHRNFPKGYLLVNISRNPPKGKFVDLKGLAPSYNLLMGYKRKTYGEKEYRQRYFMELLDNIDRVKNALIVAERHGECIFLCYEKPTDFCHRHLLQEFCNIHFPEINIKFKELPC